MRCFLEESSNISLISKKNFARRKIFAKEKIIIRDTIGRNADVLKKRVSLESRQFPQRCSTSVRRIGKRRIARC